LRAVRRPHLQGRRVSQARNQLQTRAWLGTEYRTHVLRKSRTCFTICKLFQMKCHKDITNRRLVTNKYNVTSGTNSSVVQCSTYAMSSWPLLFEVAGSIPNEAFFFNRLNPSIRTMALGSTQPLTEMSTRNFSGRGW
jgi:hypothetical protein